MEITWILLSFIVILLFFILIALGVIENRLSKLKKHFIGK